jgi:hypothetical protein
LFTNYVRIFGMQINENEHVPYTKIKPEVQPLKSTVVVVFTEVSK